MDKFMLLSKISDEIVNHKYARGNAFNDMHETVQKTWNGITDKFSQTSVLDDQLLYSLKRELEYIAEVSLNDLRSEEPISPFMRGGLGQKILFCSRLIAMIEMVMEK